MTIDQIREQIATAMDMTSNDHWSNILDNTTPGHYGFWDLEFYLPIENIWVKIPDKTFSFRGGALSFTARLGSSREEDGVDHKVRKVVSGSGTFYFDGSTNIKVTDFKINEQIDLYGE